MTPDEYMTKASRAIASAKLLLKDGDTEGTCNRAYYAMFDAAHAALIWSGSKVNPAKTKTHSGLIAAFGEQLVKKELLPVQLGKALNQVERIRLLADYTGDEVTKDKSKWAVDQAIAFVDHVQQAFENKR